MRKLLIFFTVCFLFLVSGSCGASQSYIEELFKQADSFYKQAEYNKAISSYNKILQEGFESGNIYYNLGNCYFKLGQLGEAVLNYEKAKRFIPRDHDLKSNYEYALSLLNPEALLTKQRNVFFRFIEFIMYNFTVNEIVIFLNFILLIIILSVLFRKHISNIYKYIILTISVLIIIFGLVVVGYTVSYRNSHAIVTAKTIPCRFEPFKDATVHFTLYEGMDIKILEEQDKWYKIERKDGKIGWVEAEAVKRY